MDYIIRDAKKNDIQVMQICDYFDKNLDKVA